MLNCRQPENSKSITYSPASLQFDVVLNTTNYCYFDMNMIQEVFRSYKYIFYIVFALIGIFISINGYKHNSKLYVLIAFIISTLATLFVFVLIYQKKYGRLRPVHYIFISLVFVFMLVGTIFVIRLFQFLIIIIHYACLISFVVLLLCNHYQLRFDYFYFISAGVTLAAFSVSLFKIEHSLLIATNNLGTILWASIYFSLNKNF